MQIPGGTPPNGVFLGSCGLLRLGKMRLVNQLNLLASPNPTADLLYGSALGRILYVIVFGSDVASANASTNTMPAKNI